MPSWIVQDPTGKVGYLSNASLVIRNFYLLIKNAMNISVINRIMLGITEL